MKKLLFVAALLFGSVANAYNVIYDNGGSVLAIGNVNIGGVFYNVDFQANAYSSFGGTELFWTNLGEASTASNAINTVLNAVSAPTVNGGSPWYTVLFLGPSALANNRTLNSGWLAVNWNLEHPNQMGIRTAWSVAAVPVPAAAWLLSTALIALGFARRKITAR